MCEALIEKAKSIHATRRLIPFVGAGLSIRFGFPSWSGLINDIGEELGYDADVFNLHGDYLQLAEYYVRQKGSVGPLRSILDKAFNPKDEEIAKSRAHTALVNMNVPTIYTTNYDKIIERSFGINGAQCHVVSRIEHMRSAPVNQTQVIKFHGSFEDDSSLVLTEESYFERLSFENPLDIQLRSATLANTLLFVGYSLRDINIRYLIYRLNQLKKEAPTEKDLPTGIMLTFDDSEIQQALLRKWNVETVILDPVDRDSSTDDFLEALL